MKEHTDDSTSSDVIVTKRERIEGIFGERGDVMVDVVGGDVSGVDGVMEEGLETETVARDQVTEDRVESGEKVEVVVSEEGGKGGVEVVKEVVKENVVTGVVIGSGCDDEKSGNGAVDGDEKMVFEQSGKEVEAGGGDVEVRGSDGDHVVEEKIQEETEVLDSLKIAESAEGQVVGVEEGLVRKDKAEDGVGNSSLLAEVVGGGMGEDNVHVSTINRENQDGVDQTDKESFQSTIEATTNGGKKSGTGDSIMAVETQNTTKVTESEDSKMDDENAAEVDVEGEGAAVHEDAENLNQKVEDSKMDDEPQITDKEIAVKDENVDLERGLTKEIVEQPTGSVQEVADGDHVMDEKTVKDDVLNSSKISHSVTMASLGLEDVDVEVVDEGLEGKHEAQDSVSVELSLVCSDNQSLSTSVDNVKTVEVDQKVEVDSTTKDDNPYATKVIDEADEVTTAHKELDSHVQVVTDGGILVENQSMKDNDMAESSIDKMTPGIADKVVETDMEPATIGGNSNNIQDNQDSTVGVTSTGEPQSYGTHGVLPANTEFSYEEAHMDRGEDVGMDIDEVLGWKDEIPSMQEDEQKEDHNNLSNVEEQEKESLERNRVSLQQSCYFHPPEREGEFSVSDLVWGKVRCHPWWPGQVFDPSDASENAMKYHKKDCFLVAYFGDLTFGWNDSTVLKPFREHFSQIDTHMNSEAFNKAVHCALVEVSRRVELGLTCSCIPPDIYENIKCQIVENSGIKQESSRIQGLDKSASVNSFEPDKLVDYVRLLATVPYGESNKMELTMAKAQLSSYGRFKGYRQLAEFQLCGDLLEAEQVTKDETHPEDGSKNRKGLDSISDGLEKRPTLHSETVAAKPSFQVGAAIQKVASQPTGPPLKGEAADHLAGNNVSVQSLANQGDMLSQLHLTAQDPMKGYSFVNNVVPFFKGHRAAVLSKSRKRKTSNDNESDEFEFDDVNDSYWTDRIIQNHPEEQVLQENPNIDGGHQVVAYEQEKPPVKPTRRSNKKRFFSSNHEIDANEQSELMVRRQQNLATEVLMKFADGIYFPSEIHLNKMFRRFGPLMESETVVDRQSGRARVVFKKCSDAEVAHSSAGKFNIFGSISVNYELNYTPLISYKPLPLPLTQDPPHAC